jgi:hypothetical protein
MVSVWEQLTVCEITREYVTESKGGSEVWMAMAGYISEDVVEEV